VRPRPPPRRSALVFQFRRRFACGAVKNKPKEKKMKGHIVPCVYQKAWRDPSIPNNPDNRHAKVHYFCSHSLHYFGIDEVENRMYILDYYIITPADVAAVNRGIIDFQTASDDWLRERMIEEGKPRGYRLENYRNETIDHEKDVLAIITTDTKCLETYFRFDFESDWGNFLSDVLKGVADPAILKKMLPIQHCRYFQNVENDIRATCKLAEPGTTPPGYIESIWKLSFVDCCLNRDFSYIKTFWKYFAHYDIIFLENIDSTIGFVLSDNPVVFNAGANYKYTQLPRGLFLAVTPDLMLCLSIKDNKKAEQTITKTVTPDFIKFINFVLQRQSIKELGYRESAISHLIGVATDFDIAKWVLMIK
jgi:hypothetical protein